VIDVNDQFDVEEAVMEIMTAIEPHLKKAIFSILSGGKIDRNDEPYKFARREILRVLGSSDWSSATMEELARRAQGVDAKTRNKVLADMELDGTVIKKTRAPKKGIGRPAVVYALGRLDFSK